MPRAAGGHRPYLSPVVITIRCDRCDQRLTFDDSFAGEKVECPNCGDINRLPAPDLQGDIGAPGSRGPAAPAADRASAAGLPPDDGPEVRVLLVRPSLLRSKPIVSAILAILPAGVSILLYATLPADARAPGWLLAALPLAGWIILGVWAAFVRLSSSLEITNKRTVLREGFLSRASSEVLHDHVRNIEVSQSFTDRCLRVGRMGISSSGQDGIEVEMSRVPNPRRVREIIDLYRPL